LGALPRKRKTAGAWSYRQIGDAALDRHFFDLFGLGQPGGLFEQRL
jgi:hypothetical protein